MSSKTNTGKPKGANRESGRRMYMSDDPYQDQMRRPVDKFFNNQVRVPHSENKKPYKVDDYGEMEYFAFPPWGFDFDWPQFPDSPVFDGEGTDPADNPYSSHDDRPPDELLPFLGCVFVKPFTPFAIFPGEAARAELQPRDDKIVAAHVIGPCNLIVSPTRCIVGQPGPVASYCTAVLKAKDDLSGFQADDNGMISCVVVLQTASGQSCSAQALVIACDPDETLEWDDSVSPETIGANDDAIVAVVGGQGPYTWTVSGEGATLAPTTSGVTNVLYTSPSACGPITITVEDACGLGATGRIRNTAGHFSGTICDEDYGYYNIIFYTYDNYPTPILKVRHKETRSYYTCCQYELTIDCDEGYMHIVPTVFDPRDSSRCRCLVDAKGYPWEC